MSLTPEPAGVAQGPFFPAGRLDARAARPATGLSCRSCCCVMSCGVQTCSRSASNPNSATASRSFGMNGTSTPAPGLVTSSRQHSTVNCRPTSRRRRDNPSPAGNPASSGTAGARARRTGVAALAEDPRPAPISITDSRGGCLDGYDHRGRLPQPAAHRRPRLRPAVGLHATLDTLSVAQELTAGGIDRDQAEVIANATGKLAEQGDQRHGRPAEGRSHRGPRPAADGNCRYPHRERRPGNQAIRWMVGTCSRRQRL